MANTVGPTPGWGYWRQTNPSVHTALEGLATAILADRHDVAAAAAPDSAALAPATTLGLIAEAEEGTSFVDPDLRDEYLARACCTAQGLADDPAVFARCLGDAQYRTAGFGARRSVAALVVEILASEGVDVLAHFTALARLPESSRQDFWTAYPVLCDALPGINVQPARLVDAILPVLDAVAADLTAGMIYNAVQQWAAQSSTRAHELVAYLRDKDIPRLVPAALAAMGEVDRESAYAQGISMLDGGSADMRAAAVVALGQFPYDQAGDPLLTHTLTRLNALVEEGPEPLEPALAQAFFALVKVDVSVASALQDLSVRPGASTRYALALGLFHAAASSASLGWWRSVLMNLAATSATAVGTFRNLDFAASTLAKGDGDAALQFVERVVTATDSPRPDVHELLSGTMAVLHREATSSLETAITRWFSAVDKRLHGLAASVVHARSNRDGGTHLSLSADRLCLMPPREVTALLQRVAGWIIGGAPMAALLTSGLRLPHVSADISAVATELLTEVALYNYPAGAGDYLRARLDGGTAAVAERDVISHALQRTGGYYNALSALPTLPELRTPQHRLYLQRTERARMHSRIYEEARAKSVILSLVRRVPLKYGRSSFAEHQGVLSQPTPLHSISHSVELPRGEALDPIGQLLLRISLRNADAFSASGDGNAEA